MSRCELLNKNQTGWATEEFWNRVNSISPQHDTAFTESTRVAAKVTPFLKESGICSVLWQHFLADPQIDPSAFHNAVIKRITASSEIKGGEFSDQMILEFTNIEDAEEKLFFYPMDLAIWQTPSALNSPKHTEVINKIQEKLHNSAQYYLQKNTNHDSN